MKHRIFLYAAISLMTCSVAIAGESAAEKPTAKPVAKPVAKPGATTVAKPASTPLHKAVEKPVAKPVQTPAEKPAATTVQTPAASPVQKSIKKPVAAPVETPSNNIVYISTVDNKKIAIREKQLRRLMRVRNAGVIFLYPTSVPAGFELKHIRVHEKDLKHLEYKALFQKKKRGSFTIEAAYSGTTSRGVGSRTISGQSQEFGPFKISVFNPHTPGNKTKSVLYSSDWLKLKKGQAKDFMRYYRFYGTGVSDSEAIAIVKSLRPIK